MDVLVLSIEILEYYGLGRFIIIIIIIIIMMDSGGREVCVVVSFIYIYI